jgi:hypothetical protein
MSSERRIFGQPTAGAQRVQRALVNPNEPMACPKCGSIFFTEVPAQMYTSGSYGFRSVSTNTAMKVFKCICGEVVVPPGMNNANPAGGERDLFAQSVAAALARRVETGPDAIAKGFVGIHELRELQAQLIAVQEQLHLVAETQGIDLPPTEEPAVDVPPTAEDLDPVPESRMRGRSEATGAETKGDVRYVAPPQREIVEGGARARMRRQGNK